MLAYTAMRSNCSAATEETWTGSVIYVDIYVVDIYVFQQCQRDCTVEHHAFLGPYRAAKLRSPVNASLHQRHTSSISAYYHWFSGYSGSSMEYRSFRCAENHDSSIWRDSVDNILRFIGDHSVYTTDMFRLGRFSPLHLDLFLSSRGPTGMSGPF